MVFRVLLEIAVLARGLDAVDHLGTLDPRQLIELGGHPIEGAPRELDELGCLVDVRRRSVQGKRERVPNRRRSLGWQWEAAGEENVERSVRERERAGVPEQGIAGKLRATIVLAHGPDGIRRVVDGDEAVGPLAPEPDEEAARAGADLDRVATGRKMPPQMRDLRLVDEVEDVAARWIEELRVADRPLPCGRVAFGVTRFVLVMGVTQERKATRRVG